MLALGALIALLAVWAIRRGDKPDFSEASRRLQIDFSAGLQAVRAAQKAQNAATHAQATFTTLSLMNRASIRALLPETDRLIAAISRDGLAPYLSIAIEFAYRLGRMDQRQAQEKFTALAKVALSPDGGGGKLGLRPASRMMGLIRSGDRSGYRQYDVDTVEAAGRVALSEFGRTQFKDGQTPQDLLRSVVMAWECQHGETKAAPRSEAAKKSCREFVDVISKQMADSGQGAVLPAAMERLQGGSLMRGFPCGKNPLEQPQQFIEAVEQFGVCLNNQGRPPRGLRPNGPGHASYGSGAPTKLDGYTPVGDPQVTVMGGSNPYVAVVQQYKGENGATATVTSYAATKNGQRESGTFIATDDGHGTQHEVLQTSSGGVTRSETRHPDGSTDTFERHTDGSSTTVSTNDGVTHITHTDKDGNVTTATVKENGDCTGTACQVSMPADETGASDGCHLPVHRSGGPRRGLIDPIGPYIYPEPDSPSGSPLLACVRQSIGQGSTTPSCPPSVVLCLEPPPFGSCGCSMPLPGGGPIPEDVCSQIQCADGSSCDPQTGACRGPSQGGLGGAFSPGAQPFPRPPAIILRP